MSDLRRYLQAEPDELTFSEVARGMVPSAILVIAYDVRARINRGEPVVPFTVGDFEPGQFAIPAALSRFLVESVQAGQTNYPPADGELSLREAIRDHYEEALGLNYPVESVLVASGARPVLYGAYRCLVDPGERVVVPAPSWNNANFCQLVGAEAVVVPCRPEDAFMPTAPRLRAHLPHARLLVLCSPMNPAGTMIGEAQMRAISEMVVEENARRLIAGERLLYVVFDQVYRMLTFGDMPHVTPVSVMPEMARYTLFSDAISKCFAATGLRVGWMVGPPQIMRRLRALMTHVGAWAPKPEQLATARLLREPAVMEDFLAGFNQALRARLNLLFEAITEWGAAGLPVEAIAPQGAMYLSVRFGLEGRPGFPDEESVRRYLLDEAGCAVVPFSCFGDTYNKGWMRFSVGAVSLEQVAGCLPRLKAALERAVR
jgi:aspartate aminotransferase